MQYSVYGVKGREYREQIYSHSATPRRRDEGGRYDADSAAMALASGDEAVRDAHADRLPNRPLDEGADGMAMGATPAGDDESGVDADERDATVGRRSSGAVMVALTDPTDG